MIRDIVCSSGLPPQVPTSQPYNPKTFMQALPTKALTTFLDVTTMSTTNPQTSLQLALQAGQTIPINFCWMIKHGYIYANNWPQDSDLLPLGLWGPGEILIPQQLTLKPSELRSLSDVLIIQLIAEPSDHKTFFLSHINQISMFYRLTRIRPAERRLFVLLHWLGLRFGSNTDQGIRLPLSAMNITHRQLGDLCSMTRVTVTKTLGIYRQHGWLLNEGTEEVLTRAAADQFERAN
jgi:hypothetical protein